MEGERDVQVARVIGSPIQTSMVHRISVLLVVFLGAETEIRTL